MLSAIQRTLELLFPEIVTIDDAFARRYLTTCEWKLYQRMHPADRHHGVQVAQALVEHYPENSNELIRAAILHDVGKSQILRGRWQVIPRILFHVLRHKPCILRIIHLERLQCHYKNHAMIGAHMLQNTGGCPRVSELIARHHQTRGDLEAEKLATIDALF